uniref:Uncharacterized protein n=1 Tax=Gallus gallus TaxID=9031 RepID=A0A8V0YFA0_CHICK
MGAAWKGHGGGSIFGSILEGGGNILGEGGEDNGLPVHLKGGAMDSALYHLTTLICSVGTCYSLWALAQASRPKKP